MPESIVFTCSKCIKVIFLCTTFYVEFVIIKKITIACFIVFFHLNLYDISYKIKRNNQVSLSSFFFMFVTFTCYCVAMKERLLSSIRIMSLIGLGIGVVSVVIGILVFEFLEGGLVPHYLGSWYLVCT